MSSPSTDESDIEEALRTLVLRAYADGEAIEGTWSVESVPAEIPDWEVTISRASLDDPDADVDVQLDH